MSNSSEKTVAEHIQGSVTEAVEATRDTAGKAAHTQVDAATARAEEEFEMAAEAATRAAETFDDASPQAKVADQAAEGLGNVAGALRDTDLDAATAKVTQFARENPLLFLGGAAVLGFAAARFLEASEPAPKASEPRLQNDPWTGHVTGHTNPTSGNGRAKA